MKIQQYLYHALGTRCEFQIALPQDYESSALTKTINQIYQQTSLFEQEFSRFLPTSSLSLLNKSKSREVSAEFLRLLEISKQIYTLTDGYFNPLFQGANIGYTHSFETGNFCLNPKPTNLHLEKIVNYGNLLVLDEDMELDFGGIAKGYLSEKISLFLTEKGFTHHIVNIGGDLSVRGQVGKNKPWRVGIESPFELGSVYTSLPLHQCSLSTSGTYLRKWKIHDRDYHHIQSPNTIEKQEALVLVSVKHSHGAYSDALATALQSMGKTQAIEFARDNHLEVLLLSEQEEVYNSLVLSGKLFL